MPHGKKMLTHHFLMENLACSDPLNLSKSQSAVFKYPISKENKI